MLEHLQFFWVLLYSYRNDHDVTISKKWKDLDSAVEAVHRLIISTFLVQVRASKVGDCSNVSNSFHSLEGESFANLFDAVCYGPRLQRIESVFTLCMPL